MQDEAWQKTFDRWVEPFLDALGNKKRRQWAPLYLLGLIFPGDRKSVTPMAARVAPNHAPQLHHFVADSPWDTEPLEGVLLDQCHEMLGGTDAHLIVDDTALPKKGRHSVGVAHQYCGALGKQANCQSLVTLTLSRDEVPVPLAMRLFLPKSWTDDRARCEQAGVPDHVGYRPKWRIALDEIQRILEQGVCFGDVLADAGYGMCAEFRHGLSEMNLTWAVGILCTQNVYPQDVALSTPQPKLGRRRTIPVPSVSPSSAKDFIDRYGRFGRVGWRKGTHGPLEGEFALVRVRPADGPKGKDGVHLPGKSAWLVCERLSDGELKFYLANLPASASKRRIIRTLKARWACELVHQQTKEELGLDHFEGRSWVGLHHHVVLTMIAFCFLQFLRLRENKSAAQTALASSNRPQHQATADSAAACA